jgi:hypothetical protein
MKEKSSRKKFIVDGLKGMAVIGLTMAAVFTPKKNNTTKMLTDTGELVEINEDHLRFKVRNKKASSVDIKNWIKKTR